MSVPPMKATLLDTISHKEAERRCEVDTVNGMDFTMQEDSLVDGYDRGELEHDILTVAANADVRDAFQDAIQEIASTSTGEALTAQSCEIVATAEEPKELTRELERGIKAILNASCDKRLEIFHWMVMMTQRSGSAADVVDWFFTEAESQKNEAEGQDKEIIESVFGV